MDSMLRREGQGRLLMLLILWSKPDVAEGLNALLSRHWDMLSGVSEFLLSSETLSFILIN